MCAGRFAAAMSLAPLLCLYWPKILVDTIATKAMEDLTTGEARDIAAKYAEEEERDREKKLHVALQARAM